MRGGGEGGNSAVLMSVPRKVWGVGVGRVDWRERSQVPDGVRGDWGFVAGVWTDRLPCRSRGCAVVRW